MGMISKMPTSTLHLVRHPTTTSKTSQKKKIIIIIKKPVINKCSRNNNFIMRDFFFENLARPLPLFHSHPQRLLAFSSMFFIHPKPNHFTMCKKPTDRVFQKFRTPTTATTGVPYFSTTLVSGLLPYI